MLKGEERGCSHGCEGKVVYVLMKRAEQRVLLLLSLPLWVIGRRTHYFKLPRVYRRGLPHESSRGSSSPALEMVYSYRAMSCTGRLSSAAAAGLTARGLMFGPSRWICTFSPSTVASLHSSFLHSIIQKYASVSTGGWHISVGHRNSSLTVFKHSQPYHVYSIKNTNKQIRNLDHKIYLKEGLLKKKKKKALTNKEC